ncbi:MAG: histidine phosphatase family protein [Nocardioidaceae bacterium]|nr:histidine phosphatase family protein [Nocardioidaceae bacterium]NUS50133.1 histidine phosphatase family protein [Nocardioidaceae bacterium]
MVGLSSGPDAITLVRHGESVGNVADADAHRRHAERVEVSDRDPDVALSDTGREQARAVARWLAGDGSDRRPHLVLSSPYRRARDTAEIAVEDLGVEVVLDERLRERDLGLFDGLTGRGIRASYPEEARRRERMGKFYYRPPSGESWTDVVLRVRSLLTDLRHGYDGARVWMFSHQAVVMGFRYVLEGLDEERLLAVDRDHRLANASLSTWERHGDGFRPLGFGDTVAVEAADGTVTRERSATHG